MGFSCPNQAGLYGSWENARVPGSNSQSCCSSCASCAVSFCERRLTPLRSRHLASPSRPLLPGRRFCSQGLSTESIEQESQHFVLPMLFYTIIPNINILLLTVLDFIILSPPFTSSSSTSSSSTSSSATLSAPASSSATLSCGHHLPQHTHPQHHHLPPS